MRNMLAWWIRLHRRGAAMALPRARQVYEAVKRAHQARADREILARLDSRTLDMGALLALAFAVWNVARWYMATRRGPVSEPAHLPPHRRPLEPRDGERAEEYIPEFDFTRQPPPRSGPEA